MSVARVCILAERSHVRDNGVDPSVDLGMGPDFPVSESQDNGWWVVYPGGVSDPTTSRLLVRRVGTASASPPEGIYVTHAFRDSTDDITDLLAIETYTLADYLVNPAAADHRVVWDGTDTGHVIVGEDPIS